MLAGKTNLPKYGYVMLCPYHLIHVQNMKDFNFSGNLSEELGNEVMFHKIASDKINPNNILIITPSFTFITPSKLVLFGF